MRRSLRDGPRSQHLTDLDAQVEMERGRVMQLHDESRGRHQATIARLPTPSLVLAWACDVPQASRIGDHDAALAGADEAALAPVAERAGDGSTRRATHGKPPLGDVPVRGPRAGTAVFVSVA